MGTFAVDQTIVVRYGPGASWVLGRREESPNSAGQCAG